MLLPVRTSGTAKPALVFLHFLGGSAREWDEVRTLLDPRFQCVAIDLPGFGDAAEIPGYTVAEMAGSVAETIASLGLKRFLLAGHSMGGKVAALLARQAADGRLAGLEGLILVAPSPPGPEPIPSAKRSSMLANLGQPSADDAEQAARYITKNETRVFSGELQAIAIEDVLRMNRAAWRAWLEQGSREDLAEQVGRLTLPALIVTGANDAGLGRAAQEQSTVAHFNDVQVVELPECGHLIPLEKPKELARLIAAFVPSLPASRFAAYREFIASDRVSPRTREVLEARLAEPSVAIFDDIVRTTLRAALERIIPQQPGSKIDLVARLEQQLASGKGDGWRYAVRPRDLASYLSTARLLDHLAQERHRRPFALLEVEQQDEVLASMAKDGSESVRRGFEDLRADAVALYVAHPNTLARMGYSGIGVGGAHTPHRGFVQMSIGEREPWEPEPAKDLP